jgi:EAL and modified HD-GYP domain-containing signal transduction protein
MLTSMQPIRDRRDRVVGYAVSTCPASRYAGASDTDDDSRQLVEQVSALSRLAGRSLVVPVTPAIVRDGALTRFAATDTVWMIATDALEDPATRRAVDRLVGAGCHFALQGFPEGEPLPPSLAGSTIVLDAARTPPSTLEARLRVLLDAGLRPLVRGVDDRLTRHRVVLSGGTLYSGRPLARGAGVPVDRDAEASVRRAITMLAAFADGRPTDASFDSYVQDDPHLSASLLRAVGSASMAVRGPRSVTHAITVLGRDVIMDQLVSVTARLIGDAAQDPELSFMALRRARACERIGAALDNAPHPRMRLVAGLLSTLEFALGASAPMLVEQLQLPAPLRDAMVERALPVGQLLDVIDALENGWWDDFIARCVRLGIAPAVVTDAWLAAWRSARDELGLARAEPST